MSELAQRLYLRGVEAPRPPEGRHHIQGARRRQLPLANLLDLLVDLFRERSLVPWRGPETALPDRFNLLGGGVLEHVLHRAVRLEPPGGEQRPHRLPRRRLRDGAIGATPSLRWGNVVRQLRRARGQRALELQVAFDSFRSLLEMIGDVRETLCVSVSVASLLVAASLLLFQPLLVIRSSPLGGNIETIWLELLPQIVERLAFLLVLLMVGRLLFLLLVRRIAAGWQFLATPRHHIRGVIKVRVRRLGL
mmetsp:Transcript_107532/g.302681  ORF Transcript_107532/g.302681 Transcript_107532/m.302681 type:complete len:249 (+) Transcript_107532:1017-1763(+)